jgi:biotin---protein ligase
VIQAITADDDARTTFLKAMLMKLGLEVSQESSIIPSLSRLHLSALKSSDVPELVHSFSGILVEEDGEEFIKGENDLFHLEKVDSRWSMTSLSEALTSEYAKPRKESGRGTPDPAADYNSVPKRIVSHEEAWPESKDTPYFSHSTFFKSLAEYRQREPEARTWGSTLMYGEVVTSTNTLLEKYEPTWGDLLPDQC